jgi:hypothetical protein
MKRVAWALLALVLALAIRRLHVDTIEPTRPFATCEDRAAWKGER